MLKAYEARCKMNVKIHFYTPTLTVFPKHLRAYSEDQDKRFYQYVRGIERRYKEGGIWHAS